MQTLTLLTSFEKDTLEGLSSNPKFLSSKYFYDHHGSKIFQDIMRMPEYYLTDCELEIFEHCKNEIISFIGESEKKLELIELGAGDGFKTKILLSKLLEQNINFKYIPIDISKKAIEDLKVDLNLNLPDLNVEGLIGDYFQLIGGLNGTARKLVLFLGSNIGNFNELQSLGFLRKLRAALKPGDQLLIGFDLKKDPEVIIKAYNDPHGHTSSFNLNLLRRINRELDADFELQNFFHQEIYDENTGTAKSYLISKKTHHVRMLKLYKTFLFREKEKIFMEISQKYDHHMIETLAENSGFEIAANFTDSRSWFVDSMWRVPLNSI